MHEDSDSGARVRPTTTVLSPTFSSGNPLVVVLCGGSRCPDLDTPEHRLILGCTEPLLMIIALDLVPWLRPAAEKRLARAAVDEVAARARVAVIDRAGPVEPLPTTLSRYCSPHEGAATV